MYNEKKLEALVAEALAIITGEDFGENSTDWEDWWKEQQ